MVLGKKYAWLQMVMWPRIDQWAWTMNIWHIIIAFMETNGTLKYYLAVEEKINC